MKRREILTGGLAAGAALALPLRALAQSLPDAFDKAFGLEPVLVHPAEPAPPPEPALPTEIIPDPAYDRRVLEIAKRHMERAGSVLWRRDIVGIADFARPSTLPRLHFANMESGTIRSFYVAHGRGSDPEHSGFLQNFSNTLGSEATSRAGHT